MLKVNTQRSGLNAVDSLLSDVMRFSVQYGNLTPNERQDFDAKLENFANPNTPKCESKKETHKQQANLGGNTEYDNENENQEPEYIKQLKQPRPEPKKEWLNNLEE